MTSSVHRRKEQDQNGGPLYRLMYGLLYPAVLGAIFYEVLPLIFRVSDIGLLKELLAALIVIHFAVDYATVGGIRQYGWLPFFFDLVVICALYVAFSKIHINQPAGPAIMGVSLALTVVYCAFLGFLFSIWQALSHKALLLATEAAGMLWFLLVGLLFPNPWLLVAGLAVFAVIMAFAANKAFQAIAQKTGSG